MPGFELRGGDHLAAIAAQLEAAGNGDIRRRMSREMRRTGAPLVPKVRASIMAIPSKGHKGTNSLRRQMANATTLRFRTSGNSAGMTVRVDGRKMPAGKGRLPSYMEGSRKRWRHPVFGDRDVWVDQSAHPYFYKVVRPAGAKITRELNRIARDVVREIS